MNALQLFHRDGKPSKVWYCEKCKLTARDEASANQCCCPNICACGSECERYYTKCPTCISADSEAKEKARFEKAEKLTDYDGPVYQDGLPNEGYLSDLGELYDVVDPEELPEYVWACTEQPVVSVSLDTLTDNMEMADGQSLDDLEGVKEVEAALEIFNKANEKFVIWLPDYTRCILIEKEQGV